MRRAIRTMLIFALIAAMCCSSALAASYGAKVLSSSMTIYSGSKEEMGTLKQGTSIRVTAMSGSWARISYKNRTYYAQLKDIIFNSRIKAVSTKKTTIRFVTKQSYKANTYYKATLAAGTPVYVAGFNGDTLLISNASGSVLGYVKRSAVKKV